MTLFEYISVMVSIVLGLSLAQLLNGVSQVARNSGRISAYLPHTLWLINLTLLHFLMWWSFWDFRSVEWNYARFIVIVTEPLLIFLTTAILMPRNFAGKNVDLREYFLSIRHWFFLTFLLLLCLFILDGPVVFHSEPVWMTYRLSQMMVAASIVLSLFVQRHWAQLLCASIVLANLIWSSTVRFLPAAFE